jgi:hypothetical protein
LPFKFNLQRYNAASGDVGGAEAKLVLTEKDVARLRGGGCVQVV